MSFVIFAIINSSLINKIEKEPIDRRNTILPGLIYSYSIDFDILIFAE
jgi:hypothetical protein